MKVNEELHADYIWYWEGPVARYYTHVPVWHNTRDLILWKIEAGIVNLRWPGGERKIPAGSWVIPPMRRNTRFSDDAVIASLKFHLADGNGGLPYQPRQPLVWAWKRGGAMDRALRGVRKVLCNDLGCAVDCRPDDPSAPPLPDCSAAGILRLQRALLCCAEEILGEAERRGRLTGQLDTPHPAVLAALHHLATRNLEQPLRQRELSKTCGLSEPHLRRLFLQHTGATIKEWDQAHIERSVKDALRGGELSGKQIAAAHGFHGPAHFNRWFQLRNGVSPRGWLRAGSKDGQE